MRKPSPPARGAVRAADAAALPAAKSLRKLTDVFKALADEHRLRIVLLLAEHGELSVTALGESLGQSQPAVSHHLTQLRAVGLIDYRRDGKFNFYALDPEGFGGVLDHVFPGGAGKFVLGGAEVAFRRK